MATEIKIPRPGEHKPQESQPISREDHISGLKAIIEVEELRVRLQELAYKSVSYELMKRQAIAQLDMLSNPNPSEEDLADMQEQLNAMKELKKNESQPGNT